MRITTYLKSLIVAGLAIFVLSGCSGGSTATGLGLSVSGFWSGTLLSNNGNPFASFTMSLVQVGEDSTDPFAASSLEGTFTSSSSCIGGGAISGTLNGNNISMEIDGPNGTLIMSGQAGNTTMSGTWSNSGEIAGDDDADATSCNAGGTWSAGR